MSQAAKHTFNDAERYAVWTVHGEQCWLCEEPVSYYACEVDHIIPESLERSDGLPAILQGFGLPENFSLNSWANWMPACRNCNGSKGNRIFKATPLIQLRIERAGERAARAAELCANFVTERGLGIAIGKIAQAIAEEKLPEKYRLRLEQLFYRRHEENRAPEQKGKPVEFGPGMTIVSEDSYLYRIRGRTGIVGVRPKGDRLDSSWDCPICGPTSWNGTRCTNCGQLIEPD
ncbi:HNH endonuclease signature motif containing protein [Rhizobium phaseoli]|uniref:HNH endonuclease signature motif containing protein n=1 Tax=Rhizobium phaseoli TaxID=396 RepID=UPI00037A6DFB|nr:HNH endonuclease signature motif containing protein [Rhizobium phaseoli]KKZ88546.1 HNH endonuclease [Rhizobium phaseoli Ch24-10]